ncbi:MAG: enoyl-CoA hydratase [Rhodocyclaceae bacterium]|nr:enoyl-CoA hydratase [Rhodocyclaceae bacterium]
MSAIAQQPDAPILLREDDERGVVRLTLNRPNQFNSLSSEMLETLLGALDAIAADPKARVVVLAGAGKAFCAGHDLKEMRANHAKAFHQGLFKLCTRVMMRIVSMPQPVIARIHGIATAAGCQLVSMCDLAVSVDSARFAVSGINVGLFCSTPSVGLARNMGRKEAFEMLVTGEFVDAAEAQRRGLVNRVVPVEALDAEVGHLVEAILAKSPKAIAMGKEMFYRQMEMGLEAAYQYAGEVMACNMMIDDAAEGIDAFIAKRKPNWKGA